MLVLCVCVCYVRFGVLYVRSSMLSMRFVMFHVRMRFDVMLHAFGIQDPGSRILDPGIVQNNALTTADSHSQQLGQ